MADLRFDGSVVLGRGAFGVVRSAVWRNSPVAIKELEVDHASAAAASAVIADMHREVALHWRLRHPNVVTVYGSLEDLSNPARPRYGIVLERMERTLFAALRASGGLSTGRRLQACLDIASGLSFLHAEGVVHADLKSLNVLLDKAGGCKLADFGLSSLRSPSAALTLSRGAAAAAADGGGGGAGVGTLLWMAPELHSDEACGGAPGKPTKESDVYALGVTLWECLTSAVPFSEHRRLNVAVQLPFMVLRGVRPSLEALPASLPSRVAKLLAQCWAPAPRERATADDAVRVLQRVISNRAAAAPRAS